LACAIRNVTLLPGAIWPAHIYKVSAPRMAAASANVAELGFAAQQNGLTWINVSVYSLE